MNNIIFILLYWFWRLPWEWRIWLLNFGRFFRSTSDAPAMGLLLLQQINQLQKEMGGQDGGD